MQPMQPFNPAVNALIVIQVASVTAPGHLCIKVRQRIRPPHQRVAEEPSGAKSMTDDFGSGPVTCLPTNKENRVSRIDLRTTPNPARRRTGVGP